jgi:hypothetical protein
MGWKFRFGWARLFGLAWVRQMEARKWEIR